MAMNGGRVSVIVPVLGEANGIVPFLSQVRERAAGEPIEIIVVDGDPAGDTVKAIGDRDVVTLMSPRGRGAQMNRGAAAAGGDILLFLHADTALPRDAIVHIKNAMMDGPCVGGAFDLGIESDRLLLRLTARFASLKHRLTRVPYGDQAIFLRADFFREIGGYREIPLFEDVELMRRVKSLGKRIAILSPTVMTSPRKWEKDGIIYSILRNWTLQALHLLGASPEFLARHYYGEKGK